MAMPDQGNSQRFPLKAAYSFMRANGLTDVAGLAEKAEVVFGNGNQKSTVRRGWVIGTLEDNHLLDQFIEERWPNGHTKAGVLQVNYCKRVYQRWKMGMAVPSGASSSILRPVPSEARDPQTSAHIAEVIRPDRPFSNLISLRKLVRAAERFIWWADPYFNSRGLEALLDVDPAAVREIRLLSGDNNVDERARREYRRFREEMQAKGVTVEWRILKGFSHDRFLMSAGYCVNVPSIDTIVRGQYSEILQTPNPPPFDQWWSDAAPL